MESLIIGELESGIKLGMALPEKFPHPSELKKHHLWEIENYFPQCTDMPDFICAFKEVLGFSKEVHNCFLAQRTKKWRAIKVWSAKNECTDYRAPPCTD